MKLRRKPASFAAQSFLVIRFLGSRLLALTYRQTRKALAVAAQPTWRSVPRRAASFPPDPARGSPADRTKAPASAV